LVSVPLINLWNKRSLVFFFSIMNIKMRFKGTRLGFLWAALEPLFTFILLYVVFTSSIRISDREDFGIYLLTGIIFYHIFTRGTMGGLGSLQANKGIIQSLNIRREFFPVIATVAIGLLMFVEVGVFFGLLPFFNFFPTWTAILLPLCLLLLFFLILGFSYILSIVSIYVRDILPFWGIIIHALFFVSPIFWYVKDAQEILLVFQQFNPLGQIIEIAHKILVFGQVPPLNDWLYTTAFVVGILFAGYAIFQKYQYKILEEI